MLFRLTFWRYYSFIVKPIITLNTYSYLYYAYFSVYDDRSIFRHHINIENVKESENTNANS